MKIFIKLLAALLLTAVFVINLFYPAGSVIRTEAASSEMRDLKAADIVADMGLGWNLGNTLDSHASYSSGTNYKVVAFYMDGTGYAWSMSQEAPFGLEEDGKSAVAELSWKMSSVKSADNSKTYSLGFQIWNFADHLPAGTQLPLEVLKAEIKTGGATYSFPGLLGKHTVTMDAGGVASFEMNEFDSALKTSGQLKAGTLTLTIRLQPQNFKSKQEYFETVWGNPITTRELIDKVKAAGFHAVRVPVTWFTNMDTNGKIDAAWLDRVEQVVNYVLDNDMYCIINVHHDTAHATDYGSGWLTADTSDPARNERFAFLWEQIAARFKDYGDHLLFESFNEILVKDKNGNDVWGYPGTTAIDSVNKLNQIFVDTVRASGGNNALRHLVVNTYAASSSQIIIDGFVLPTDTIKDHLIVQVHDYTPMEFGFYDITWTNERSTWGTPSDRSNLDAIFERLDKRFISNGIPVIIGEFGTCNKNNNPERAEHAGYYVTGARKKGIVCFWWDNGGDFEFAASKGEKYEGSGLINRRTLKWEYPELVKALTDAAYSEKTSVFDLTLSSVENQTFSGKAITPALAVKDGSLVLTQSKDYKISYTNNKNPGTATVTITGMGKYYGTTDITFLILPGKVKITSAISSKSGSVTVKWSSCTGAEGYIVSYSTSKTGTYRDAGYTKDLSYTMNKLTKGKTYYFKVRAYITKNGATYCGDYGSMKSVKVK